MKVSEVQTDVKWVKVPSLITAHSCGFGTPFSDGMEYEDIPYEFVKNAKEPYIITAKGSSMEPVIYDGDKLIIDIKSQHKHNDMVTVFLNGDYLVKIFYQNNFSLYLKSKNTKFKDIKINEDDEFHVLGKVVGIYREF